MYQNRLSGCNIRCAMASFFCYILFTFILLTSCNNSPVNKSAPNENDESVLMDYDTYEEKEELVFSEVFQPVYHIKLQSSAPLIAQIDKIIFRDQYIFILDQEGTQSIFAFDTLGRFLGTVGEKGFGPNEYEYPEDIAANDDHLIICTSANSLLWYDLSNLSFVKSTNLSYQVSAIASNPQGGWYIATNQLEGNPYKTFLLQADQEGVLTGGILPNNNNDLSGYLANGFYLNEKKEVLYTPTHSKVLYTIKNNIPKPIFSLHPAGPTKGIFEKTEPIFMNAPILCTPTHMLFSTFFAKTDGGNDINKVYTNIFNKKNKLLTTYRNTTIDWLGHALTSTPLATWQDSLIIWPIYPDGMDAYKEWYKENKLSWQEIYRDDKLALDILSNTRLTDNPSLLFCKIK